jgi:hypothetical protein
MFCEVYGDEKTPDFDYAEYNRCWHCGALPDVSGLFDAPYSCSVTLQRTAYIPQCEKQECVTAEWERREVRVRVDAGPPLTYVRQMLCQYKRKIEKNARRDRRSGGMDRRRGAVTNSASDKKNNTRDSEANAPPRDDIGVLPGRTTG